MRGSFQTINKFTIILASGLLVFSVGCGKEELVQQSALSSRGTVPVQEQQEQQEQQPIDLTTVDIVHIQDDGIVMRNSESNKIIATILATAPQYVTWNEKQQKLYWVEVAQFSDSTVEVDDQQNVIREFDAQTGDIHSLHWSRRPIENLVVSSANNMIAFTQDGVLYTLIPEKDEIQRIAGWVEDMKWAPDSAALIVSFRKTTEYISFDQNGVIVSRLPLIKNNRFAGTTFLDAKTVVGLQWTDEGIFLTAIDLRTAKSKKLDTWSEDPVESANHYFSIFPSPDTKTIIIHQLPPGQQSGTLWEWSFDTEKKKKIKTKITDAQYGMTWISNTQFWYATIPYDPTTQHVVSIHEYDTSNQNETEILSNVDSPVYIHYSE